jgi:adenylosuccinate synthase
VVAQPETHDEMEGACRFPLLSVVSSDRRAKGKVALEIVRRDLTVDAAIRVGGTNSGHTAIAADGKTYALRQLPAALVDRSVGVILPPGSYIDIEIFRDEVRRLGFSPDQVAVSRAAAQGRIATPENPARKKFGPRRIGHGNEADAFRVTRLPSIGLEAD